MLLLPLLTHLALTFVGASASAAADGASDGDASCPAEPGSCAVASSPSNAICVCHPRSSKPVSPAEPSSRPARRHPLILVPADCHHASVCPSACPPADLPADLFAPVDSSAATALTKLSLQGCGLRSVAETSLRGLGALTSLLLDANHLGDDSIEPKAFTASTPSLQTLHLSSNRFTSFPDIELPPHLEKVSLAGNRIGDCGLSQRARDSSNSVISLTLSSNPLTHLTLACLPPNLEALVCRACPLNRIDSLGVAVGDSLTSLTLSLVAATNAPKRHNAKSTSSGDDAEDADAAESSPDLDEGDEAIMELSAAFHATNGLSKLTFLHLSRFGGPLKLSANQIGSYAWTGVLKTLDISEMRGGGLQLPDSGSGVFARLVALQRLRLVNCELDKVPAGLPGTLLTLDLSNNRIHAIQPATVAHLTSLTALTLAHNPIASPPCLCLPSLADLRLPVMAGLKRAGVNKAAAAAAARQSRQTCPCPTVVLTGAAARAYAAKSGGGGVGSDSDMTSSSLRPAPVSKAAAVGGGVGGFVALLVAAAIALAVVLVRRRRRPRRRGRQPGEFELPEMPQPRRQGGGYQNNYADSSLDSDAPLATNGPAGANYGSDAAAAASRPPLPPIPPPLEPADSDSQEAESGDEEQPYDEHLLPPPRAHLLVCSSADRDQLCGPAWLRQEGCSLEVRTQAAELTAALAFNWRSVAFLVSPKLVECRQLRRPLCKLVQRFDSSGAARAVMAPRMEDTPSFARSLRNYCLPLEKMRHKSQRLLAWDSDPLVLTRKLEASLTTAEV